MKKSSSFSGSLGFVLAAAGSAVGVGNIWRFPYLCAKDGGGLFLLVYLVLVLTFGFALLTTDVAIGRRTKQNALNAFATLNKKWRFLGYLTFLVPTLIMTYYSVIGGWITKYFTLYLVSSGNDAAQDGFFTSFITSPVSPIVFMLIFLALTAWVVYRGVEKGIEKYSRYIMPGLLLLIVGISNLFGLTALNWLLMSVVNNGALVLVILFQAELRKALEQIGRGARIETKRRDTDKDEATRIIDEIIRCVQDLSRRRVGALIVFEQKTGLQDIIENGIGIDARITSGLLENIFEPNTPLHDGAVVIRGERVMSAASILTLTEASGISHDLGTRHRAAIGVSETTDAIVLIVSEETGIISMAKGGKLTRHLDAKSLRTILEGIYVRKPHQRLLSMLVRRKGKEGAK